MEQIDKIVHFDEYCPTCKYETTPEKDNPCNECLDNPTNTNTRQPVMWKEK